MAPKIMMFWVAEYTDGTAIAQYDPDNGQEILFSQVDQSKLKKISWYPFTRELISKVAEAIINPLLNPVSLLVPPGAKVKMRRRNHINYSLASGRSAEQQIDEYIIGIEGNPLLVHVKNNGSVEIYEE